jgi:hypothetical protein
MGDNAVNIRRIRDLLYLEECIVRVIHEEIINTTKNRPDDIIDRIKYICDESMLGNTENLKPKEGDLCE